MALESATYIDGLVTTNPVASDAISTADDHLRLIKSTVKATFPNITGPVTVSQAVLNGASPAFTGTPTAPTAPPGTDTTQIATTAFVQAARTAVLGAVYPVGSIYTNAANSTNPGTLLGFGTWTAFGAGRVMVGFNASDPLFDSAEETGGSKDATVVAHTHTGTAASNGAHTHNYDRTAVASWFGGSGVFRDAFVRNSNVTDPAGSPYDSMSTSSSGAHTHDVTVNSTGSSGTNANLQPYITVYMWKRTA
jgi:hypothetical protein